MIRLHGLSVSRVETANHAKDFDIASVIDKGGFTTRITLEAWHSKQTPNADNNSCPLPGEYSILFNKYS